MAPRVALAMLLATSGFFAVVAGLALLFESGPETPERAILSDDVYRREFEELEG